MQKAYKYRVYPTDEQKAQLAKLFGCCRFVYNHTLAYRKERFEKFHKNATVKDCIAYYHRALKTANPWLAEADEPALINAIYHMDLACRQAYQKHGGYPKFKCKHDSHKSYTTNLTNGEITVDHAGGTIRIPGLPAFKATLHRTFTGQIKSATISQSWSGKYYISLVVEAVHQDLPHIQKNVGLNLRDKNVCVTSDGQEYVYGAHTSKHTKRLAKLQKQLKRKEKGSSNYYKLKKEIAVCHEHITNTTRDQMHKISHEIISENQVIIFEKLLPQSNTCEPSAALLELQKLLEFKAKWNHRYYVKVDPRTTDTLLRSQHERRQPQDVAKRILAAGLKQTA